MIDLLLNIIEKSLELMQFVESDGFMKVMNPRDWDSFDFGVAAGIRPIKRWWWTTKKVACFLPSDQFFLHMLLGNVFFAEVAGSNNNHQPLTANHQPPTANRQPQ
jgi:hypothetical protein